MDIENVKRCNFQEIDYNKLRKLYMIKTKVISKFVSDFRAHGKLITSFFLECKKSAFLVSNEKRSHFRQNQLQFNHAGSLRSHLHSTNVKCGQTNQT